MNTRATIYHNPRCSKSRQTLALLEERGIEPRIVLYLETPPDADELKHLLEQMGMGARDLLRTGEGAYRELELDRTDLSEDDLIAAMVAEPILIERPIVITGQGAALGRPPENVLRLL
jgi:arsenate reductase (glutaredoxin)